MKPTYRIKDWDRHFENAKSRTIDNCSYVGVPNKQHGLGFTRIMAEPDGAAIFGVWMLIVEAVSRQPKPRAGWLTADGSGEGEPWTINDLALQWRRPEKEISRALNFLSSSQIGWIEQMKGEATGEAKESEVPREEPEVSAQYPPGIHTKERTERTEQKEGKKEVGSREKPRSPGDGAKQNVKVSDEEWIGELQRSEAYNMFDVKMLHARMTYWCQAHRKQPTRRRFIAWLNREDIPTGNENGSDKPRFESATERNARNLRENVAYIRDVSRGSGASDREDPIGLLAAGTGNN